MLRGESYVVISNLELIKWKINNGTSNIICEFMTELLNSVRAPLKTIISFYLRFILLKISLKAILFFHLSILS
jgi:hypothetical protein